MIRTATIADEAEDLRAELRQFMASRPDLSPIDLVQYTTLSECTGRHFLNGNLPGGSQVLSELGRVLELAKAGDVLRPGRGKAIVISERGGEAARPVPKRRNMYETETVKRIGDVLTYCAKNATIGVVTADFGVGKTEAVRIWKGGRGRDVQSLVIEFHEFNCCDKLEFIAEFARVLGLDGKTGFQQAGRVFRSICEHLRSHPCLVILDQAETVRPRICQIIRQVWDRTHEEGVGFVLLAAPVLLTRLLNSKLPDLGALASRIGVYAPLNGISKTEMLGIVKGEGLTEVDDAAMDLWWRSVRGSMRRLMGAIDLLKAKHAPKRVTERTIASLATSLWGMNIARGSQTI